ncbi:hypothetical protein TNCV_2286221 [Trichonephila clavipes]|nr:hypothetical protein TNCV_2286221 [Trichonephila clavipes]
MGTWRNIGHTAKLASFLVTKFGELLTTMTLEEDLKHQPLYQDSTKDALSDLSLEIKLDIPFDPNQDPQDIPQQL